MKPAHFSFLNSAQVSIAEVAALLEPSVGARFIRLLMWKTGPVARTAPDAPRVPY